MSILKTLMKIMNNVSNHMPASWKPWVVDEISIFLLQAHDNDSQNCWSFFVNNTCSSDLLQLLSPDLLHEVPDSLPLIIGHHLLEDHHKGFLRGPVCFNRFL